MTARLLIAIAIWVAALAGYARIIYLVVWLRVRRRFKRIKREILAEVMQKIAHPEE